MYNDNKIPAILLSLSFSKTVLMSLEKVQYQEMIT